MPAIAPLRDTLSSRPIAQSAIQARFYIIGDTHLSTQIHAALFDLDGMILDTEGQYTHFYGSIGRGCLPDVPDFALQIKGRTLTQIYEKWFPGKQDIQNDITRRLNAFEQQMDYTLIP